MVLCKNIEIENYTNKAYVLSTHSQIYMRLGRGLFLDHRRHHDRERCHRQRTSHYHLSVAILAQAAL